MQMLDEQLQIVLGHWHAGEFSFTGNHYRIDALDAQPKPVQTPHPPLLMGGLAGPLAARLAASYADEYNTVFAGAGEPSTSADPLDAIYAGATLVRERRARIVEACEAAGRDPIPFSVMTPIVVGMDEADLHARAARTAAFRGVDVDWVLAVPEGWLVGTVEQVAEQLHVLKELGVSRVLCQLLPHDDLEFIAVLAQELAPRVA
jgi:alkanesulfonate monooxygenase SsuD/methylene tetrahydromethanopterin reductase-like flavin-dependent oxidoreductase (luciferase family)